MKLMAPPHASFPVVQLRHRADRGPSKAFDEWPGVIAWPFSSNGIACTSGLKLEQVPELFRHPCLLYRDRAWLYLWRFEHGERIVTRGVVVIGDEPADHKWAAAAFRHLALTFPRL